MTAGDPLPTAVLDSEALSAIAEPRRTRQRVARRAQAVLEAIERRGGVAVVPAPVLVEVRRGARAPAVDRVVNKLEVVASDRRIAAGAGQMLERHRLDSCHAVDALVVATAQRVRPALVLTSDPSDLGLLSADDAAIAVQSLP